MKIGKRVYLYILIAVLCLCLPSTSVQARTNSGEVENLKLYISAIEEIISIDSRNSTGMLYDIDSDGFDELIMIYYSEVNENGETAPAYVVFSVFDVVNGALVNKVKNRTIFTEAGGSTGSISIANYQSNVGLLVEYQTYFASLDSEIYSGGILYDGKNLTNNLIIFSKHEIENGSTGQTTVKNCTVNGNRCSVSTYEEIVNAIMRIDNNIVPLQELLVQLKALPSRTTVGGFKDVHEDDWFAQSVQWAVENSVTFGTSDTTFSPNDTCTNAHILTFLWRAVGSPIIITSNPFSDVKSTDYYYIPALWAYTNGLVTGSTLNSNAPCTRASTVTFLWKLAGQSSPSGNHQFNDVPADADYASAVAWAVGQGITAGTSMTTFSPNNTCTRGQIVTFLYRFEN